MADETGTLGPISYLIVEFPGNEMTDEGFAALLDLVDRGVIRILDLMFVKRDSDGSMRALELQDIDHDGQFDLAVFAGASSGLLAESDLSEAASMIETGVLSWDPDLREPLGDSLHPGVTSRRRSTRGRRIHPPGRPRRSPRRRRGLIEKKGRRHATSPRSRSHRWHRWNGHSRIEPRLAPATK